VFKYQKITQGKAFVQIKCFYLAIRRIYQTTWKNDCFLKSYYFGIQTISIVREQSKKWSFDYLEVA